MKWRNKDNTRMIDLDKVSHFCYSKDKSSDYDSRPYPYLWLTIQGDSIYLLFDEATEVYNLIKDK